MTKHEKEEDQKKSYLHRAAFVVFLLIVMNNEKCSFDIQILHRFLMFNNLHLNTFIKQKRIFLKNIFL
jgi:hypothetical protein